MEGKCETGCLLKNREKSYLEEVTIKKQNVIYFYRVDPREKNYFLHILLEKYRYFREMIADKDLQMSTCADLYELLWNDISIEELQNYLKNKRVERLEKRKWKDVFLYDEEILYDAHISLQMKKSLIYDYLSLMGKNVDFFHKRLLEKMMEELDLPFEKEKVYQLHN